MDVQAIALTIRAEAEAVPLFAPCGGWGHARLAAVRDAISAQLEGDVKEAFLATCGPLGVA